MYGVIFIRCAELLFSRLFYGIVGDTNIDDSC